MFAYQESRAAVDVAFTDRHGGVSGGPYASLNLAASGGDDPAATEENLRRVDAAFRVGGTTDRAAVAQNLTTRPAQHDHSAGSAGGVLVRMHQVHGADVRVVDDAYLDAGGPPPIVADGIVTKLPGVPLMVRVADCVPVLLADLNRNIVGAAHAGRPGLVAGIVAGTVAAMRELGAQDLTAWLGPHVCGSCYEVPAQMRDEVSAVVPEAYAQTSWGTPAVDVGRGVRAQLEREGAMVVDASRCTIEDEDLFSYRRQGKASGRLAGLVWVRP